MIGGGTGPAPPSPVGGRIGGGRATASRGPGRGGRRRRCRSAGRCRRRRGRARASARSRAGPPARGGRSNTSGRPSTPEVAPRLLRDAVQEDLERLGHLRRQITRDAQHATQGSMSLPEHLHRMPPPVRRKLLLACRASWPSRSSSPARRSRTNGGIAPPSRTRRTPSGSRDATGRPRRHRASSSWSSRARCRLRRPLPAAAGARDGRGPADPRHDAARADLDGHPGADPRRDRRLRLLQAAGDQGRPERERGRPSDDRRGRGPPVLLAYTYPNGAVSVDRAARPGRPVVDLAVTAPDDDVIHSWWVPAPRRQDGRDPRQASNHTWFVAAQLGVYQGQCAEFCGIQHALMLAQVQVVADGDFEAWSSRAQARRHSADLGKETFQGVCAQVPRPAGQGYIGPRSTATRCCTTREGLEQLVRERAAARCRRSARTGRRSRSTRSSSYTEDAAAGGAEWRLGPSYPHRCRGGAAGRELADDRRPQADRDPLHRHRARLLRRGRGPRAADARRSSRTPNENFLTRTPTTRCSRCTA